MPSTRYTLPKKSMRNAADPFRRLLTLVSRATVTRLGDIRATSAVVGLLVLIIFYFPFYAFPLLFTGKNSAIVNSEQQNQHLVFEAFDPQKDEQVLPESLIQTLDAIFVLGGGVPSSLEEPPLYVQRRCDVAAAIVKKRRRRKELARLPILTLSAGTAHLPQLLSQDGLPIWESTSSAAYLQAKHGLLQDEQDVYVETTSYDTISNAFFSRTSFSDIVGWRSLLIVTNEFHMHRTQEIFDWIYGVDPDNDKPFRLFYVSCNNIGLSNETIAARAQHENTGATNVREKLMLRYTSLKDVWSFLNHNHSFYAAGGLIQRAQQGKESTKVSSLVKESYGGGERKDAP